MKKLGFGMMRLPVFDENDRSTVDTEHVIRMVDLFMQNGFNYFDTAHRYNDEASEPAIKAALTSRYKREDYVLTDKVTLNYIKKESDLMPFFEKQLKICGVDYFDNYLVHNMGRVSYEKAKELKIFEFIADLKAKGLVKHTGFSFHDTADTLEKILSEHPEIDIVQLQINYLDWNDSGIQAKLCYETAVKHKKDVKVMEPIKGGNLINLPKDAAKMLENELHLSPAEAALRFAASLEGVSTVLSGMSTEEQLKDNSSFMKEFVPLTETEKEKLEEIAELIRSKNKIPCTGCRYCVTECPKHIAIPEYFSLLNNRDSVENVGYFVNQSNYYGNLAKDHGKASSCVECGTCEKNCPQHIKIRQELKKVAEVFENIKPLPAGR